MNFNESLAFYLVVGLAVGAAQALVERSTGRQGWILSFLAAWLFWPLFLPLLLASHREPAERLDAKALPCDGLSLAIRQVEQELDDALSSLDGWAEDVLHRRPERLRELRTALIAEADRIRAMEALVAREHNRPQVGASPQELNSKPGELSERGQRSEQARKENMNRLLSLCRQSRTDLLATLAWIRELVSMIHLAKFTGAPAARAEELVAQIAAAVESISSLSAAASPGSSSRIAHLPGNELDDPSLVKESVL
jgi:hypothetical protein